MDNIKIAIVICCTILALLIFTAATLPAFSGSCQKNSPIPLEPARKPVPSPNPIPLQPAIPINTAGQWKNPSVNQYNPAYLQIIDNGGKEINMLFIMSDGSHMALSHPLTVTERSPAKFKAEYVSGKPVGDQTAFFAKFETLTNGDLASLSQGTLYSNGGVNSSYAVFQKQ
jgi:hypothetical protein